MLSQLKVTFRQLGKSPGFTAACIVVLALGMGANTAIFSVVEAALLRPLPFPDAKRLVRVYEAYDDPDTRANTLNLSEITLQQWREHARDIFADFGAATGSSVTLGATSDRIARSVNAAQVTADFFPTLGLSPARGRYFTSDEDRPNGPRVAIVGYDFWQRELGGRADVLGASILLDNAHFTIVGIMPSKFRHPYRAEVWLPLGARFDPAAGRGHYLYGAGRLRQGVTIEQANSAMRRICAAINAAAPDPLNPRRAYIRPLREGFVVDLRPKLIVISAAAFCALLVASANFAGLLLARAVAREGETAIRASLGASRPRLVRETLSFAVVLAAIGAAAGLVFASWLTPILVTLSPEGSDATGSAMREFDFSVRLDWPVFMFTAGAVVLAGAGFGLLPAWRVARTDLRSAISSGSRSATLDRGTRKLLGSLVVAEIAVSAVLLVTGALLAQYFKKLIDEPWGLRTEQRLTFNTMMPDRLGADGPARARMVEMTLARLRALPGVQSATATLPHPLYSARELVGMNVDGQPAPEPRGYYLAYLRAGVPGYFATVGQQIVFGRDFTEDDRSGSRPVAIVSQGMAKRFWPNQDPIGKRVKWGLLTSSRPWLTVVGVAADAKVIADPDDGEVVGVITMPMTQLLGLSNGYDEFTFVLHTTGEPRTFEAAARAALANSDSRLAAYEFATLDERATESRAAERFVFVLVSLFGVLGLILAAIGLYGLLALQVACRAKEFGIRSALGATAANLVRLVVAQGLRLSVLGLLIGSAGAWAVFSLAHSRWPELPALTLLPFAAAGFVLVAAVLLASLPPARRAARVDPASALRSD